MPCKVQVPNPEPRGCLRIFHPRLGELGPLSRHVPVCGPLPRAPCSAGTPAGAGCAKPPGAAASPSALSRRSLGRGAGCTSHRSRPRPGRRPRRPVPRVGGLYSFRPRIWRRVCSQAAELCQQRRHMAVFGFDDIDKGPHRSEALDRLEIRGPSPVLVLQSRREGFDRLSIRHGTLPQW